MRMKGEVSPPFLLEPEYDEEDMARYIHRVFEQRFGMDSVLSVYPKRFPNGYDFVVKVEREKEGMIDFSFDLEEALRQRGIRGSILVRESK